MTESNISLRAPEKVSVIGVPVSAVSLETALDFTYEMYDMLRGAYVCAANVHTTVMAYEDAAYKAVQSGAVMNLPDGKPLAVVGGRKTTFPMKKTTGTHYMQGIFADDRFAGKHHYFYGTRKEDLERMIPKVQKDYPDLQICGWEPSVFRELSEDEINQLADRINAAKADFLWVALGAPRQENLMFRLRGKVNCLMTGVGGAFHILSGAIPDAPVWMQNAGLEWLFRLCKEPKRLFKRYFITNTKFLLLLLRENCHV